MMHRVPTYYGEHEILHTFVILNGVKDFLFSPDYLKNTRFFAALRMTTIIRSE